jgi:hypothetical protein
MMPIVGSYPSAIRRICVCDTSTAYAYLKPTDVVGVEKAGTPGGENLFLKVTSVREVEGNELLDLSKDNPPLRQAIESQVGRVLNREDGFQVVEALRIYDWQIDQNRPVV